MSLQARFDSLRTLATLLEQKQPVPAELWAAAGVKTDARLKDVQVEIVTLKKKVSLLQKEEHKASDDDEEAPPGEDKEKVRQDVRVKKDQRRLGLDKKNTAVAVAEGKFDLACDYAD